MTSDESVIAPVLRVRDAEAATAWYERLGFAEEWRHRFEDGMPLYVGLRRLDGARLHLSEHRGDAHAPALVYLYVPEVDALARACGTHAEDLPWAREFQVTDPDGNRLRVGSPVTP